MKIGNKTLFLFGGENKTTAMTCSNSVLFMAEVRMG
jgi:hypothetical protein